VRRWRCHEGGPAAWPDPGHPLIPHHEP